MALIAETSQTNGNWSEAARWLYGAVPLNDVTNQYTVTIATNVCYDDGVTIPTVLGNGVASDAIIVNTTKYLKVMRTYQADPANDLAPQVDHVLRLEGNLSITGTFSICTTAVKLPIDRKFTLQIDCSTGTPSDGKYGLKVNNGGTFVSQPVNPWGTSLANPDRCFLAADNGGYCNTTNVANSVVTRVQGELFAGEYVADAWVYINGLRHQILSVDSTSQITLKSNPGALTSVSYNLERTTKTLTTDVSTAWKDNDRIALASTSRTYTDCESYQLNGAAAGTTLTIDAGVSGLCDTNGTAVTRNGTTGCSFLQMAPTGIITINAVPYTIASITSATALTLTATAGVQNAVAWSKDAPSFAHIGVAMNGGIASYDHTGGTSERLLTRASGLPFISAGNLVPISPLADGTALQLYLDGVYYTVDEVKSSTTLTLTAGSNPGGDLTSKQFGIGNPCKAEVINLTRNVLITGYGTTYVGYVVFATTATVDVDWTEFAYMGEAATDKYGVVINTTTGSCNLNRCSFHDFEDGGIYVAGSAHNNWSVNNSVLWNVAAVTANHAISVSVATTGTNWTIDNNIVMYAAVASCYGINLYDIGGTVTNNTVVGARAIGITYNEGTGAAGGGLYTNNTIHSCGGVGFTVALSDFVGIYAVGLKSYRNTGVGIALGMFNNFIHNVAGFGNSTYNLSLTRGYGVFKSWLLSSDSVFSTTQDIATSSAYQATFIDLTSGLAAINYFAVPTYSIIASSGMASQISLINSVLNGTTPVYVTGTNTAQWVRSSKHNGISGVGTVAAPGQKSWYPNGTIIPDATYYRTASPSQRLTPASPAVATWAAATSKSAGNKVQPATPNGYYYIAQQAGKTAAAEPTWPTTIGSMVWDIPAAPDAPVQWRCISPKLQSDKKQFAIDSAGDATVSVYLRKSAAYDGNQPRLIALANPEIGILTDTVLATFAGAVDVDVGPGTFTQLSGSLSGASITISADGVVEVCVDCDGTAGWINVDDWSVA